jgi:hypothetical protein
VLASRKIEMNNQSSRSMKHLVIDEKTRSHHLPLLLASSSLTSPAQDRNG